VVTTSGRVSFRPTEEMHSVTTLELFFDLVFVFAFTQVTALMASDPTVTGALRGLVVLALLWWAWCSYAWLGNQAHADEGVVRATVIVALAAMFIVALSIPESFDDLPGGLFAPFVLAACYAVVRLAHLVCYWLAAGDDSALKRQLLVTAVPVVPAVGLLVLGGALGPPEQTVLWALALLVDYTGIWVTGTSGWRVHSAAHFAERHQLIVIVALGESLVAIGVGVEGLALTGAVVLASLLGVVIAVALWWLYFDVVAPVAERALAAVHGEERTRLARDSYTYLHFPMVIAILYTALGLKKVLEYVADTGHHEIDDPLTGMPLVALYGGVALYLLAHVAFRRRNVGTWNPHRTVTAAALLLLLPVASRLPAIWALGLVTGILVALVVYERVRFGAAREEVRQQEGR
jgi:low temperature requirement protein LtrA